MNENQPERAGSISGKPGDLRRAKSDETSDGHTGGRGGQEARQEEGGAQAGGQGGGRPAGRRAEPMQAEALWVAAPTEPWPCDDQ